MEINKAFYIDRVHADIEKYSKPWNMDYLSQYFNADNCQICRAFRHGPSGENCPGCIFHFEGKKKCSDGFPDFRRLIELFKMIVIIKARGRKEEIISNQKIFDEFEKMKKKRREMYQEILKILTGLPESRFDGKGNFPEVQALGIKKGEQIK